MLWTCKSVNLPFVLGPLGHGHSFCMEEPNLGWEGLGQGCVCPALLLETFWAICDRSNFCIWHIHGLRSDMRSQPWICMRICM